MVILQSSILHETFSFFLPSFLDSFVLYFLEWYLILIVLQIQFTCNLICGCNLIDHTLGLLHRNVIWSVLGGPRFSPDMNLMYMTSWPRIRWTCLEPDPIYQDPDPAINRTHSLVSNETKCSSWWSVQRIHHNHRICFGQIAVALQSITVIIHK